MFRRARHLILNMMGRGYPPVIFIEPGEDPTKDRQRMISPINTGRIITIVVVLLAMCPISLASASFFFKPKPKPAAIMLEGTQEATSDGTIEPTAEPTQEPTATPIIIVVTATATPTETATNTPTATHTFTPTPTNTPAEVWQLWMTATQFEKDVFGIKSTDIPYWQYTSTPTGEP